LNKKNKDILRIIGLVIFVIIISKLDFVKLKEIIIEADISLLLLAVFLNIPVLFIKAARWKLVLGYSGSKISMKNSLLYNTSGIFLGIITPGRIGELAKVFYLKNESISYSKGITSVIIDRMHDLFLLLFFGFIGLILYFPDFFKEFTNKLTQYYYVSIVLLFLFLTAFIYVLSVKEKISQKFIKITKKLNVLWNDIKKAINIKLLNTLLLTFISLLITYLQAWLIGKSFNIGLNFLIILQRNLNLVLFLAFRQP